MVMMEVMVMRSPSMTSNRTGSGFCFADAAAAVAAAAASTTLG